MRIPYSLALLSLFALAVPLSGCQKEESPSLPKSSRGVVIGQSCNGLLIELLDGPQIGRPLNIYNKQYTNVFGAATASPALIEKWTPRDTVTFRVLEATKEDAAPRLCLAIYLSYDVPQRTIAAPE